MIYRIKRVTIQSPRDIGKTQDIFTHYNYLQKKILGFWITIDREMIPHGVIELLRDYGQHDVKWESRFSSFLNK